MDNEYSEEIAEKYEEPEVDDDWLFYGHKENPRQTKSWEWFED